MKMPEKKIEINGVQYAQASEFKTSGRSLERFVSRGKVRKVTFANVNYYDIKATEKAIHELRNPPAGYVKASTYGAEKGFDVYHMRRLCATRGAPAVRCAGPRGRSAWYADKAWLDKKLGITVVEAKDIKATKDIKTQKPKEMSEVQKAMYNLAVLIERAESLVGRLEAVLGTEKRAPNTLNVSITPANGHAKVS